jgi:lysosomal alpha-mannosidase
MQKRELNKRDEFDFEYTEGMNITSNFYPVDSAIYIRDDDMQLTVSNSHSQGGSAIQKGRIELV